MLAPLRGASIWVWVAMHRSTSEDAECEPGRKSKIRARLYLENHENCNF